MDPERPTIEQAESLGRTRFEQLAEISAAAPSEYLGKVRQLDWLQFTEVIDHSLTDRGGFSLALFELVDLLKEIVLHQRGPGILGYFRYVELSFSPRAGASYDPASRVLHLNLGFLLFLSELEATCQWLESLVQKITGGALTERDLTPNAVPAAVREELATLFRAGATGQLAVSGKNGLQGPVGRMLLRFVLAHEVAHLIDAAESTKLQQSWRETAWQDYEDALQYGLASGWFNGERYARFRRQSLTGAVATQWSAEFVADSLGFYTMLQAEGQRSEGDRRPYAYLQVAVELFFYALALIYRGDIGTDTHPAPTLRATVIRARRRQDHHAGWKEFLDTYWAPGFIASVLIEAIIRGFGSNRTESTRGQTA